MKLNIINIKNIILIIFVVVICNTSISFGMNEIKFQETVNILMKKEEINASRLKTIEKLEKSRDKKAVPYIIKALKDHSFSHRFSAIRALVSLGGLEAFYKRY